MINKIKTAFYPQQAYTQIQEDRLTSPWINANANALRNAET